MDYPQLTHNTDYPTVTIETNHGDITLELYPDKAPITVHNFIRLAEEHYYDDIIFHRVIENFMIQGGDPTGTGRGGESIYKHPFEDEFHPTLFNFRGALSMANSGPGTNGSQFFIVTADSVDDSLIEQMSQSGYPEEVVTAYREKGGTPWLDHRHTVFGHVIDGMSVVETIGSIETDANDKPIEDVKMLSLTVENKAGDWAW
ncbi:peptidylprolyl isomerase [Aerococcus vaginalis]